MPGRRGVGVFGSKRQPPGYFGKTETGGDPQRAPGRGAGGLGGSCKGDGVKMGPWRQSGDTVFGIRGKMELLSCPLGFFGAAAAHGGNDVSGQGAGGGRVGGFGSYLPGQKEKEGLGDCVLCKKGNAGYASGHSGGRGNPQGKDYSPDRSAGPSGWEYGAGDPAAVHGSAPELCGTVWNLEGRLRLPGKAAILS